MATQKKTTTTKKPATKKTVWLSLEEAAAHLGITEHELTLSRYRGMEPGTLAKKVDGVLMWDKADLGAAVKAEPEA